MNESKSGVSGPIDREILITRVFDAPRELVFAAWTDPELVVKWWGPKGYSSFACEIDLRVGGVFRLNMRGPDGAVYPCTGVFREVVKPERLVYTGSSAETHPCGAGLPPNSIITVNFVEHDRKTTLTIHTRLQSAADRDAAVEAKFVPGWTSALDRLAEFLPTT
jgi:uncharacterized protein YndB with AHSA1/START domain